MPRITPTHQAMLDARTRARTVLRETEPHMIRGLAEAVDVRDRIADLAKIRDAMTALYAAMLADLNYNLEITGKLPAQQFLAVEADNLADLKGEAAQAALGMANERLIETAQLFEDSRWS